MNNFIAIVFAILLTIIIGTSVFMGDKDSVKSATMDLMNRTNTEIHDLTTK